MVAAPERADARANRQRIIQAALEVLAERGAAAEIKEVAERAGVGVGTIYRNFATKDDLMRGILDDVIDQFQDINTRALSAEDPIAGIRVYISEMYAVLERWSPAVMAMLSGAFTEEIKQRFMEFLQDKRLEELFRKGIAQGKFRKDLPVGLARGLLANICDPMVYLAVQGEMPREEMTAGFTDLILRAVVAPE
ncbi:MAG: TetR/AcrR family transcriptional regulator [bacterium]